MLKKGVDTLFSYMTGTKNDESSIKSLLWYFLMGE